METNKNKKYSDTDRKPIIKKVNQIDKPILISKVNNIVNFIKIKHL